MSRKILILMKLKEFDAIKAFLELGEVDWILGRCKAQIDDSKY